jgi:hypothetical protein
LSGPCVLKDSLQLLELRSRMLATAAWSADDAAALGAAEEVDPNPDPAGGLEL